MNPARNIEEHLPVVVGLLVIGVIGVAGVLSGTDAGMTIGGAAIGGVAGWLTKGAFQQANIQHADVVQPGVEADPPERKPAPQPSPPPEPHPSLGTGSMLLSRDIPEVPSWHR